MKPRVLYLHIGTEKTGTTTLQALAAANRALFAQNGLCYPRTPGDRNHMALAAYASDGQTTRDLNPVPGLEDPMRRAVFREEFAEALRTEVASSGASLVWLSNEHLSSRLQSVDEIKRLASLLLPLADQIRVVVYLRHQPDLFLSFYSTLIKSGNDGEMEPPVNGDEYFYNFEMMLDNWAAAFGENALSVRVYDKSVLRHGDIVTDFLDMIGFDLPPDAYMPERENVRLDTYTLQFLRLFHRDIPGAGPDGPDPVHGDIITALEALSKGPPLAAPAKLMREIDEVFHASNNRVARRFLRRDGALFPPVVYPDPPASSLLTPAQAVKIAAGLWRHKQLQVFKARAAARRGGGGT